MTPAIEKIYSEEIEPLPAADRLRLAKMILDGMPPGSAVEEDDDWGEEDLRDAVRYSFNRANAVFGMDNDT